MCKFFLYLFFGILFFTSCSSHKKMLSSGDSFQQLSRQLGFKVERKDNVKLYTEAAKWLGVPYRFGGNSRKGVDCSGLTCIIYKTVYHISLERTVAGMYKKNCRKINKNRLQPGDLVFFNTAKNSRAVSHVGIFLKDDVFIHATTHSGVRLSRLSEEYYRKKWICGGKIKNDTKN